MGNQLEKQYNLKTKPIKLVGSYQFLRFTEHPSDPDKCLIIIKSPHKVGNVHNSTFILPILNINQMSNCTVAVCPKCTPLALHRPKCQAQLKIILYKIIKTGSQLGRYFICQGRLMLWGEEKRSFAAMSPEQFLNNKVYEKSQVFTAGIAISNYLYCIYEKSKAEHKTKKNSNTVYEIPLMFDPKDRKQYSDFLNSLNKRLITSYFWTSISHSMQDLLQSMLELDHNSRVSFQQITHINDFIAEKQLILYVTLADELEQMPKEEAQLFMQTLQHIILKEKVIEDSIMNDYFVPVLISILYKKPMMVLSCLIQVPNPPSKHILHVLKKYDCKVISFMMLVLQKKQKLYRILNQEEYDACMSRIVFSIGSFECKPLWNTLMTQLPYFMRTIKQSNCKKQIQHCLVNYIIMNSQIQEKPLLLAFKATIQIFRDHLLTSVSKYYSIIMNPNVHELQVNLHILHLYGLIIEEIAAKQLINVMIPKLQPYLSSSQISDQLFYVAESCMKRILKRLQQNRNISEIIHLEYKAQYFKLNQQKKIKDQEQKRKELLNKVLKNMHPNVNWLKNVLGYVQIPKVQPDIMNQ